MDKSQGFPSLGIGTMLWVPRNEEEKDRFFQTYKYCIDRGYNFFDTAEVYDNGKVESMLGEFIQRDGRPVRISSKFAPPSSMNPMAPKRKTTATDSPKALLEALDGTLLRLGVPQVELYLMHTPPKSHTISEYMDVMAEAVREGKIQKVGVCNFSAVQIEEAAATLEAQGLSLSAAMVGYNITKERDDKVPFIKRLFSKPRECDIKRMEPILCEMEKIGAAHGKSLAQVALNWLCTTPELEVFPIPGMRNVKQAADNIGAVDWKMTAEERECICSAEVRTR